MLTRKFDGMGTRFELFLDAPWSVDSADALDAAIGLIEKLEARMSRFRPDSELSSLNREGSARIGHDLRTVVELALAARDDTAGRFDPTVLSSLVAAGYDRPFDDLPANTAEGDSPPRCAGDVHVDRSAETVTLGEGVGLDLGGIAKGYAAERACDILGTVGPCLVNAGGDIATRDVPDAGWWAVEVPTRTGSVTIGLRGSGLATSGRDRRRWRSGGKRRHHIIDPRTGRPSTTDIVRITVAAESAVRAETLATSLILAGSQTAIREASAMGVSAIVVTDDLTYLTPDLT